MCVLVRFAADLTSLDLEFGYGSLEAKKRLRTNTDQISKYSEKQSLFSIITELQK